eukprot:scaffold115305_cov35-Tisochrysis_lutea.AAC.2
MYPSRRVSLCYLPSAGRPGSLARDAGQKHSFGLKSSSCFVDWRVAERAGEAPIRSTRNSDPCTPRPSHPPRQRGGRPSAWLHPASSASVTGASYLQQWPGRAGA